MFKKYLPWYLFALVILSLAFIYGCGAAPTGGGGGGGGITGTTYYGTQSGGDLWKWVITATTTTAGTFSGQNITMTFEVAGTYEVLPSKFCKAYVNSASGAGAPTPPATAYFLEFPNTMLLVKPIGTSNEEKVIVCAAAASSPPSNGTVCNFVNIPWSNWHVTDAAYGTAEVISGASYTFEVIQQNLKGDVNIANSGSQSGFAFSDGIFSRSGDELKLIITPSGVFVGDSGPGHGGFAGATAETSNLTDVQSDIIGKQFRGVLFNYDPASNTGETQPIGATGEAGGKILGASFTNIEVSPEPDYTSHPATLEFTSNTNGMCKGTLKSEGTTNGFALVYAHVGDTSKVMVFGIATQEGSGKPQNFLVIER